MRSTPLVRMSRSVKASCCSGLSVPVTVTRAAPSTRALTSTVERTFGSEERLAMRASTSVSAVSTGGVVERST